ncbi:hypothetical protein ccbrp13_62150 [Ktedonobacteria bacterium brp13]|nr:hypothetical protein ccbrp13_62150 [Ktedonobacteria bacterium brp13]
MSSQYLILRRRVQAPPYQAADVAQAVGRALAVYLFPLFVRLDQQLDKGLVRTFLLSIQAILTFRDRMHGFCQNSGYSHVMQGMYPHFHHKKAEKWVHCSHLSLILDVHFPTLCELSLLCSEF